jgi:hypothetical protein
VEPDTDPEGDENYHQKYTQVKKFCVEVLDVLILGLKFFAVTKLQIL